ncbi:MAG TPA: von Willebrand factor type A domain-containing protein [Thermoanaerobaculia bacterium]|nr:von Willebrand factor type A domain-containing protein [Thermoanaerobaculia bacterium]
MKRNAIVPLVPLVLLVLLAIACSHSKPPASQPGPAPTIVGTVAGVVVDDTGAPLPGVTVRLLDAGQPERVAITDVNGRYSFPRVDIGVYGVFAHLAGFSTAGTEVAVKDESGAALTTTLRVATVTESITVTAEAPAIWHAATYTYDGAVVEPRYSPITEHGFVTAKKAPVATFAIDVDRASYANIRRYIAAGFVPPPDAVRIEELVNYFTYGYPQPGNDAPFSVTTEVAGCPWKEGHRLLRVGIQGRNLDRWRMAPNNLVFLIDVSGSMDATDKLPLLKQAFQVLIEQLRAEDRVAIVVYAGAAGLVLPSTSGADKRAISAAIDNLKAGGATAGGEGIELAYEIATQNFIEEGNNRVILASDGDFNVGVSSVEALQSLIEKKRRSNVFLSVLGVGRDNLRDDVMETLADKGNGNYSYLDTLAEAEKVFRHELTGTLVTIASDVKVQLEFDPAAVRSYRQIGYERRALEAKDFDDDQKDAGELGAGHSVTALFEIVPAASAPRRLGTLRLRYKQPRGTRSEAIKTTVVDEGRSAYEASPDLQFAAAVAELGMLLRDSPHKGTATWDDVLRLARVSIGPDLDGSRQEFLRMAEATRALSKSK